MKHDKPFREREREGTKPHVILIKGQRLIAHNNATDA